MSKISNYPSDTTPVATDYVLGDSATGPSTIRFLLSTLATFFWTLANIPAGATSPITRDNESQLSFVASGGVWSGDSYAVNKNASMTALVCYINGRRISIAAVTARTFTASVDTYIDVLDNGDGTGTLVYTTALNNAASPALAANSMRIGIIVTGATTIAAAGSVNQGQETMILPIASSIAYSVSDSLGNLICPRDPAHRILCIRQVTTGFATASTTAVQNTGMSCPVIVPTGRKVRITCTAGLVYPSTINKQWFHYIYDGTVGVGTLLETLNGAYSQTNPGYGQSFSYPTTPTATSKTYNWGVASDNGGGVTTTLQASATQPMVMQVELI